MTRSDDPRPLRPKRLTPSPQRVAAFETGISAESKACVYLIAKGYRILARRFRTPQGEIDVVARHRGGLVFVEVKARDALDDAAYAVTPRQRARIAAAAEVWLMTHPDHANLDCRFDVILIAPKHLPRHLKAAFDLTG
ncbi:MAG: YraN family protein [Afipia sp.]|jgi:putative endonuclease